jgi:hypothetical protein
MPDYALGKMYRLWIGKLVYIGSTTQPRLSLRLGQHKNNYNQWVKNGKKYMSSFELFKLGIPRIELIELFPCGSKDELRAREGHHQRANDCVNKHIAGQTREEYYVANQEKINERAKQYNVANKEKISKREKQYYVANKEKISKREKQYRGANKEKISKRDKQYYVANKEKLSEYYRVRYANNKRIERLALFIHTHIRKVNSI